MVLESVKNPDDESLCFPADPGSGTIRAQN